MVSAHKEGLNLPTATEQQQLVVDNVEIAVEAISLSTY